jgi:2-polyprenyl-6-methoxyphenol hydroxylase-like FAD-dependent oxidoreductase
MRETSGLHRKPMCDRRSVRDLHVLVAGASVAGPSLAFWLERYGARVTLLERAPAFRDGGQNIDVRGAAREVLRRAGLEEAALAATTGELGTRFLAEDGSVLAEFPVADSDTEGATAEMEVLRGDLARILVDALGDGVEIVFGDRVTALHDDGDGVDVELEHGGTRRFDLVVAADGIRSSTRSLVLGDEVLIHSLGLDMTYLTLQRTPEDVDWWRWCTVQGGAVNLRPDRHGTTRALLSEATDDRGEHAASVRVGADTRSAEEQRAHLRERFGDAGWEAPRILDALDDADDLYFEAIGQVHAPRWSSGRVALVGDAAWCASPVSGVGTSLAIVGAYVLAGELAAHDDHRAAFEAYEQRMRPYVERGQDLPPGTPGLANPTSRIGLGLLRAGLRIAGSAPVRAATTRLTSPPADDFDLPDYSRYQHT